jgi:hypothetical protein
MLMKAARSSKRQARRRPKPNQRKEQVVTNEEVQQDLPRYQLIKRRVLRKYIWIGRRAEGEGKTGEGLKRTDPNFMQWAPPLWWRFSVLLRKTVEPLQWPILVFGMFHRTTGRMFSRVASKLSFRKSAKRRLKAQPHAPFRTNGLKTNVD